MSFLSGIRLKFWNFEALIWAESGVIKERAPDGANKALHAVEAFIVLIMKLLIWKLCKKRWKLELWQNYLVTALSWNCMGISPSNIQQKIPNKWNMTMVRNLTTNHYIGCHCDGVSFDSICTWSLVVMDWVARTLASKQSQYAQMPFSTDAALLLSSSKKFSNIQSLMEVTGSYLSKSRQLGASW